MEKWELINWLDFCYKELSEYAGVKTSEKTERHFEDAYFEVRNHVISSYDINLKKPNTP